MSISTRLSATFLSVFALSLLTVGCAHKKVQQGDVRAAKPFKEQPVNLQVTLANSDFAALHLSGQNELPANDLNASGKLFLKVNKAGTKIYFTLHVDSLKNIIKATINYGTKTYNGPPIVNLYPARHTYADSLIGRSFSGVLNSGVITQEYLEVGALAKEKGGKKKTIRDFIRVLKNDSAYVQIHTKYIRDGAIRAQIKASGLSQGS